MSVYMDHNATSPMVAPASTAMREALAGHLGNPSSVHGAGRQARDHVEAARREVAALLGAAEPDVVFTSGGTEADWLGVASLAARADGFACTTGTAHPALIGAAEAHGGDRVRLPVDASGRLDLAALETACRGGAGVVAASLANHEVGTTQDIPAMVAIAREHGVLVHCDAVQAAGRVALDVAALGADCVAISAHKIGGPMGVGALWIRPGIECIPAWRGGKQERGRRPGTENLLGIIGFGAAARHARTNRLPAAQHVRRLTDSLEAGLGALCGARIHGASAARIGNTICVGFDGVLGEVVVQALDMEGIAVSTGAACTSGTSAPSPTLRAMGLSQEAAREAVRLSLGPDNTEDEVQVVLELMPGIIARARLFR